MLLRVFADLLPGYGLGVVRLHILDATAGLISDVDGALCSDVQRRSITAANNNGARGLIDRLRLGYSDILLLVVNNLEELLDLLHDAIVSMNIAALRLSPATKVKRVRNIHVLSEGRSRSGANPSTPPSSPTTSTSSYLFFLLLHRHNGASFLYLLAHICTEHSFHRFTIYKKRTSTSFVSRPR